LAVKVGKIPENNNCVAILETQWGFLARLCETAETQFDAA